MKKFLSNSKFAGVVLGLVVLLAITTAAGVNGIFNSVNSDLGYKVAGGAGSAGQALCSNGTLFNTPCSITSPFYQTVDSAGVAQTQRAALDFSSQFTLSDSASPSKTIVALAGTARTCTGSYPDFSCYKIASDGTIEEWGSFTSTTYNGAWVSVTSLTFPYAFTTTPSLTLTIANFADGTNQDSQTAFHTGLSTTGASIVARCPVNIGGSGCSGSANAVPINWQALGN